MAQQITFEAARASLERQASSLALDYMVTSLPAAEGSPDDSWQLRSGVAAFSAGSSAAVADNQNQDEGITAEQSARDDAERSLLSGWGRNSARQLDAEPADPELRRRWRISRANRGRKPWNVGKKHKPGVLP